MTLLALLLLALYGCNIIVAQQQQQQPALFAQLTAVTAPVLLAVDSAGYLYAATEADSILRLSPAGEVVAEWNTTLVSNQGVPIGLCVVGSEVYLMGDAFYWETGPVPGGKGSPIMAFSINNGNLLSVTMVPHEYVVLPGTVIGSSPWTFVAGPDGQTFYVLLLGLPQPVYVFSLDAAVLSILDTPALPNSYLSWSLAMGSDGALYMGVSLSRTGGPAQPALVMKVATNGTVLANWSITGASLGLQHSIWPASIAVAGSGQVFIADENNGYLIELSSQGQVVQAWNATANGISPSSIAVDYNNDLYVADSNASRIWVYRNVAAPSTSPSSSSITVATSSTSSVPVASSAGVPTSATVMSSSSSVPVSFSAGTAIATTTASVGLSGGVIAAIVFGVVIGVLLCILSGLVVWRWSKSKVGKYQPHDDHVELTTSTS